jgi:MFS family permease
MVAAIAEPGERETWFGFLGALRNSGFAIGGLLAGVALTVGTGAAYQTVVVLNALSFVASFVLLLGVVVHDPGLHAERPVGGWATVVRDRGYRWLVITNFAYAMVGLALNLAIPVYLVGLGLPGWLTGAVFVLNTVLIGIGQGLVVRAMTGVVRTRIITASAGFAVVSFALLWLVGLLPAWAGVAVTLVAAVVYTLNELAGGPVLATLASEAPPVELRGRYQAAYQLSWNGASALAPLLFAWLLGIGSLAIWGVLAGIALVGAACCVPMARSLPLASRAVTNAAYDPAL